MRYMGDYGRGFDSAALDRYITGNYGEDQFRLNEAAARESERPEKIVCGICGEEITQEDQESGDYAEMYDPNGPLVNAETARYGSQEHAHVTCHAECGLSKGLVCA